MLLVVFDKKVVKYGDHEAVHAADVADEAQRAAGHYRQVKITDIRSLFDPKGLNTKEICEVLRLEKDPNLT